MIRLDVSTLPKGLRIGTSSFSSVDWHGGFYPQDMPPTEFLRHYAEMLNKVEIDATWHAMPSRRTFQAWTDKTPDDFVFSLKVPKVVTHDRYLVDCEEEWARFLESAEILGPKLGPIVLQFPYVARGADPDEYRTGDQFRRRLEAFLPLIPSDLRAVVEVRNRTWLAEHLCDLLRSRGIALAMIDYYTMPDAAEWLRRCDPITADFGYIRFLGDHKRMDQKVSRAREEGKRSGDWSELLEDRESETRSWVRTVRELLTRLPAVYAYYNNHYAGFAPGSIDLFLRIWEETEQRVGTPGVLLP